MTTRRASCSCGQLHLTIEGEPSCISMCHCLECQRRTGAAISNQARPTGWNSWKPQIGRYATPALLTACGGRRPLLDTWARTGVLSMS